MKEIVETLRALGPFGVLVLAVLDSAGVPMVGGVDALLIWVSVTNPRSAWISAGLAVIGSVLGSLILLWIGRKGGEAYLEKHTSRRLGAKLKGWFLQYGVLTIFVPALVPIVPLPLKVFVLCAGAFRVNPLGFAGVILVARALHYFAIAWLGLELGNNTLPYLRHHIWLLVGIAIGSFVALYLVAALVYWRRKVRKLITD